MERTNQLLIEDIKGEVMAELRRDQNYSNPYHNRGYQAYCQLVDAVKQDVLHQLESQAAWRPMSDDRSGLTGSQLSRTEMDLIKREVLQDLQLGMEGERQRMLVEQ